MTSRHMPLGYVLNRSHLLDDLVMGAQSEATTHWHCFLIYGVQAKRRDLRGTHQWSRTRELSVPRMSARLLAYAR